MCVCVEEKGVVEGGGWRGTCVCVHQPLAGRDSTDDCGLGMTLLEERQEIPIEVPRHAWRWETGGERCKLVRVSLMTLGAS